MPTLSVLTLTLSAPVTALKVTGAPLAVDWMVTVSTPGDWTLTGVVASVLLTLTALFPVSVLSVKASPVPQVSPPNPPPRVTVVLVSV